MQQPQSELEQADILASSADWVLVKKTPAEPDSAGGFFMVWVAENPASVALVNAAQTLENTKNIVPGIDVRFCPEPEPGFILDLQKNWHPDTPETAQRTLDQIIWELNRLTRG